MRKGHLYAALAVLALLAGFVWLFEVRGGREREAAEEESRRLLPGLDAGQVAWLRLEAAGQPPLRVARPGAEGAAWRLEEPLAAEADADEVQRLVETLVGLQREGEGFEPGSGGRSAYGLDPPQVVITAGGAAGEQLARLEVGGKNPVGFTRYASRQDSPLIWLIPAHSAESLAVDPFRLREKRLVRFQTSEVTGLRIEPAGLPAVSLALAGERWVLESPLRGEASRERVDDLLWELAGCRARRIAAEGPEDLAPFGLLDPAARLTVLLGGEGLTATILFGGDSGNEGGEALVYARSTDSGPVLEVTRSLLDSLLQGPSAWREERLFPLSSWEVKGLDIARRGGQTVRLRQEGPDDWRAEEEGAPEGMEVDGEAVSAFIYALTELKACAVLDEPPPGGPAACGLDRPELTIVLYPQGSVEPPAGEAEDQEEGEEGAAGRPPALGEPLSCRFGLPPATGAPVPPADCGDGEVLFASRTEGEAIFVLGGEDKERVFADPSTLFAPGGDAAADEGGSGRPAEASR